MSGGPTPVGSRHHSAENRGKDGRREPDSASDARLRDLVECYRRTDGERTASDDDLRHLVEEDQARRLLQAWKEHVACLRTELAAINAALEGTGVCLEPQEMAPGPGVSYLACVEVRLGGDAHAAGPSAFAALTRRAEARLQIRMPGCARHETRYLALAEIGRESWKGWLLDLLEAHRDWQRIPR